jgi:hypothetical protein
VSPKITSPYRIQGSLGVSEVFGIRRFCLRSHVDHASIARLAGASARTITRRTTSHVRIGNEVRFRPRSELYHASGELSIRTGEPRLTGGSLGPISDSWITEQRVLRARPGRVPTGDASGIPAWGLLCHSATLPLCAHVPPIELV